MKSIRKPSLRFAFALAFAVLVSSCGEDESPTSPPPPPTPGDTPQSVQISDRTTQVATWNYDPVKGPNQATGPILVGVGETYDNLSVQFLGDFRVEGSTGRRDTLDFDTANYVLQIEVADTMVVQPEVTTTSDFSFRLVGRAAGSTIVNVRLMFNGSLHYESGDMTVLVYDGMPSDPNAHFILKKNGIWTVIVDDGQLLTQTCNNIMANPGRFETEVGELTDLYFFKFINALCRQEDPPNGSNLVIRVEDTSIAQVVNHPLHFGEREMFHIYGMQPGQTSLQVFLVDQDVVLAATPPVDVVISAAGP